MPEVSFRSTRLTFYLLVKKIQGLFVFFFICVAVQNEEIFSTVELIAVPGVFVVTVNCSVVTDSVIFIIIAKIKIFFVAACAVNFKQSHNHTAVDIIPARFFSGTGFFDIPNRKFRRRFRHQIANILFNYNCIHLFLLQNSY